MVNYVIIVHLLYLYMVKECYRSSLLSPLCMLVFQISMKHCACLMHTSGMTGPFFIVNGLDSNTIRWTDWQSLYMLHYLNWSIVHELVSNVIFIFIFVTVETQIQSSYGNSKVLVCDLNLMKTEQGVPMPTNSPSSPSLLWFLFGWSVVRMIYFKY